MDIQGQPSNRSKTKVWGRSGEGGGGSGHVLDVPNGAEGGGLKYIALKLVRYKLEKFPLYKHLLNFFKVTCFCLHSKPSLSVKNTVLENMLIM